jgi:hypothetical protein
LSETSSMRSMMGGRSKKLIRGWHSVVRSSIREKSGLRKVSLFENEPAGKTGSAPYINADTRIVAYNEVKRKQNLLALMLLLEFIKVFV